MSTDSDELDDLEPKKVVKMVFRNQLATTPISILVESLVKNLCTMIEPDEERALKIYNQICNKLFEMHLIDESYQMREFEGMRSQYQRALYHLVTAAREGEEPAVQRMWPNISAEWSHYQREFDEIEFIAGGGFGQVFRVRHKLDGTEYAVKKIYIRSNGIKSVMSYLAEVKTFASLNHSNIVQYKAAWLELGIPTNKKAIEMGNNHYSSYATQSKRDTSSDLPKLHNSSKPRQYSDIPHDSSSIPQDFPLKPHNSCDDSSAVPHCSSIPHESSLNPQYASDIPHVSTSVPNYSSIPYEPSLNPQYPCDRSHDSSKSYDSSNSNDCYSKSHKFTSNSHCFSKLFQNNHYNPEKLERSSNFTVQFETTKSKQYSKSNNNISSKRSLRNMNRESRNSISEGGKAICKFNFDEARHFERQPEKQWATLFIQMALCQITLKQWLETRNEAELPQETNEAALVRITPKMRRDLIVEILEQLLRGLEYIHSKGIVHHDIKPSNIFMQLDGGKVSVQLGDFGLACPLQSTRHSLAFGTKLYAAPEQLAGKCNSKSDLYSLGIVLLELVETFRTDMERIQHITELRKGRLSAEISAQEPQLAHIISQLVGKHPNARPTASELLQQLTTQESEQIRVLRSQLAEKDAEIARLRGILKVAGVPF